VRCFDVETLLEAKIERWMDGVEKKERKTFELEWKLELLSISACLPHLLSQYTPLSFTNWEDKET